jgi:hypothetical protein
MSNSIIGWPWYVKLPGMVAGFFVSAFSSKLPDGLQSLGLWVGIGFGVRVAQTRHLTTRVSGDFLLLREVQLAVEPKTDAAFRMSGQSCSAPLHRFLSVIQCRSTQRTIVVTGSETNYRITTVQDSSLRTLGGTVAVACKRARSGSCFDRRLPRPGAGAA